MAESSKLRFEHEESYCVVYGYSDDLVEIESREGNEEIDFTKVSIAFADGTIIRIEYNSRWIIKVTRRGTARFILEGCSPTDESTYSDKFTIYGTRVIGIKKIYR